MNVILTTKNMCENLSTVLRLWGHVKGSFILATSRSNPAKPCNSASSGRSRPMNQGISLINRPPISIHQSLCYFLLPSFPSLTNYARPPPTKHSLFSSLPSPATVLASQDFGGSIQTHPFINTHCPDLISSHYTPCKLQTCLKTVIESLNQLSSTNLHLHHTDEPLYKLPCAEPLSWTGGLLVQLHSSHPTSVLELPKGPEKIWSSRRIRGLQLASTN